MFHEGNIGVFMQYWVGAAGEAGRGGGVGGRRWAAGAFYAILGNMKGI